MFTSAGLRLSDAGTDVVVGRVDVAELEVKDELEDVVELSFVVELRDDVA